MILALPASGAIVWAVQSVMGNHAWPWWWSAVLAIAWAPLLWVPRARSPRSAVSARVVTALAAMTFLTLVAGVVDRAPVGAGSEPMADAGVVALVGMGVMYLGMTVFQLWPHAVVTVRRWVYAGFYMDEGYTHWVLRLWPARWAGAGSRVPAAFSGLHGPVCGGTES
ncbi:putative inorganic carbon transporter subunit DabB OS=Castellaniella defragrans OX=75697 GN=dabB PE=3 SV=1 [Castellaniella defragrans]